MAPRDTSSNSKESGFICALENLRVSIIEVTKYGQSIKIVEDLQREKDLALQKRVEADAVIKKQQKRISDQVETIKSLEKEKEATFDTFELRFKTWAIEEARLNSEIQNIKTEIGLNQHKELADLKKKIDALENQITLLKGQYDQQITLNTGLEERLLRAQTALKYLNHSLGLEEICPDLYVLSRSCRDIWLINLNYKAINKRGDLKEIFIKWYINTFMKGPHSV